MTSGLHGFADIERVFGGRSGFETLIESAYDEWDPVVEWFEDDSDPDHDARHEFDHGCCGMEVILSTRGVQLAFPVEGGYREIVDVLDAIEADLIGE